MIFELLKFEEGYQEDPYHCSEGYPTVGIGTKIGPKNADLDLYQFTISESVAREMLVDELVSIREELVKHRWYTQLDESRKYIIQSMCYQIGIAGVFKFKKMIKALEVKDWEEAAKQALDSRWSKQTPDRANRHADVLRSGNFALVYGEILGDRYGRCY